MMKLLDEIASSLKGITAKNIFSQDNLTITIDQSLYKRVKLIYHSNGKWSFVTDDIRTEEDEIETLNTLEQLESLNHE